MTTREAAALLRVSPRYVRQLIDQGRLSRSGRVNHRLNPVEVKKFSDQRKRGGR